MRHIILSRHEQFTQTPTPGCCLASDFRPDTFDLVSPVLAGVELHPVPTYAL